MGAENCKQDMKGEMSMINTHICRICKHKEGDKCLKGYLNGPNNKDDCMYFRHKEDKYNFSSRSGESTGHRLQNTWEHR